MENAQDIAKNISSDGFNHKHAVGKAQQVILDALEIEAESFGHANAIFKALGFVVEAVRQGRRSIPKVRTGINEGGALNRDGEGECWDFSPDVDLSAIKEWM